MTAANIAAFGERGTLVLPGGTTRAIQMIVSRHDFHSSEIPGQLQLRFTVRVLADSTFGATAAELDAGTWKVIFPDDVGAPMLQHDIGRKHGHFMGFVDLEIYGAGYPLS